MFKQIISNKGNYVYFAGCGEFHSYASGQVLEICCIQKALKSRVLHMLKLDHVNELAQIVIDEEDLDYCRILDSLFEWVTCNKIYYAGNIIEVIKAASAEWCWLYEIIMRKWISKEFCDVPRKWRTIAFIKMFINYPPFRSAMCKSEWLSKRAKKAYPDNWISEVYPDILPIFSA